MSIILGALIAGCVLLFVLSGASRNGDLGKVDNVSIVDGTQVVTIDVKGGYRPRVSTAKAGIPTVLRFDTDGTYDCSSSIRIPSRNISRFLPPSGSTDIGLGTSTAETLAGSCGMGMYSFQVNFEQ